MLVISVSTEHCLYLHHACHHVDSREANMGEPLLLSWIFESSRRGAIYPWQKLPDCSLCPQHIITSGGLTLEKTLSTMVLWTLCYHYLSLTFGHGVGGDKCLLLICLELLFEDSLKAQSEREKRPNMARETIFPNAIYPGHRTWVPLFRCWRAIKVSTELCEDPTGHMRQTVCFQRWPQQYLPSLMLFCSVTLLLPHEEMGLMGHLSLNLTGFRGSHVK